MAAPTIDSRATPSSAKPPGTPSVIDARGAQLHFSGWLPATGGDGLGPAAALDESIKGLSRARNFSEIRLVDQVMLFEQINQALFDHARFVRRPGRARNNIETSVASRPNR